MADLDYVAHLRADSQRFADALAGTDPAAPVPPCPDWTAADLLWHLGEVQLSWATIVADRMTDRDTPDAADAATPDRPADYAALLRFFRESSARLADALEATSPDTHIWTWFPPDQTVGFARRRQAHEALIHRLDAELTAGGPTELDPALATDGVAEVFDVMYGAAPSWGTSGPAGPIGRVAASDTGAEWLVQVGSWSGTSPRTGTGYVDEGTLIIVPSGDVGFEVSGTAGDLDAWLWNRPAVGEIALAGNYEPFVAVIRQGVQ